jgi:DNA-binding PadR family transcriptional regulator
LSATDASKEIPQLILEALKQGDKNRGELFDLIGEGYPVLVPALQKLKDKKLIESYFAPTETVSVLTYRLHSGG